MPKVKGDKQKEFLTYFGKKGKAPGLKGWEYSPKEMVKDKTFDSLGVVYYRTVDDHVARAEAGLREGFYFCKVVLTRKRHSPFTLETYSTVVFEPFYRAFQQFLKRATKFMQSYAGHPGEDSGQESYYYYMFEELFGEDGKFIPYPKWEKDDIEEHEQDSDGPGGLSVFFFKKAGSKNNASILVTTDYKTHDVVLSVITASVVAREESKSNITSTFELQDIIANFMKIADLDLDSRKA